MKRLLFIFSMLFSVAYGQICADEDTVRSNSVSLITYNSARINGTTSHFSGAVSSLQLKYVRVGQTDTVTSSGSSALRNITGLQANTQYVYYYKTICGSGSQSQTIGSYKFTTLANNVAYTPMDAMGYQFKYLKVDTLLQFVPGDTSVSRGGTTNAAIKYKSSDNTFYGYYPSCNCWRALAIDSAGIISLLDGKVDSVTVNGDSLFYWKVGVSYGYILPALANTWRTVGNAGTSSSTNFIGTTDYVDLILKAGGTQLMKLYGDDLGKVSIGIGNVVTGDFAKSFGNSDTASGEYATAFGVRSNAVGANSFAAGENTFANGILSVAFGVDTRVDAQLGFGMGETNILKSYGGTVFGTFNDTTDTGNPNSISSTNRLFQIGNGTADISRSNALTILSSGKSGFGTTTPDSLVTISGGGLFANRGVRFSGLPTGVGTKAVRIDASGNLSIADTTTGGSSGLTVGSTSISSGTNDRILYQSGGVLQQSSNLVFNSSNELIVGGTDNGSAVLQVNGGTALFKGALEVNNHTFYNDANVAFTISDNSRSYLFNMYNNGNHVLSLSRAQGYMRLGPTIASTSAGVMFQVDARSATDKGLLIKGASSQSANLIEAQDNSSNVLFSVNQNGTVRSRNVIYQTTNASDADFTAAVGTAYVLPDPSTGRTITLPTGQDADKILFYLTVSPSNSWNLSTNVTILDGSTVNKLDTYGPGAIYLIYDGANSVWRLIPNM